MAVSTEAFRIDRSSALPLHAQIEAYLRQLILEPAYSEGALLPCEEAMSAQLGVSRNTVRAAMSKLIFEGVIERRPGLGTRVVRRTVQTGLSEWHSFSAEMATHGIEVVNYFLEARMVEATIEEAAALQLRPETKVFRLTRVRGWDDTPVVLTSSTVHPRLKVGPELDWNEPFYNVLYRECLVDGCRSSEMLSAELAGPRTASRLGVREGAPLLFRKRTTFDLHDNPIEFNLNWYRSDIHSLRLELTRGQHP